MLIGNTMGSNNSKRGLNKAKDMPIICMQNKELLSSRANSRNTQRLIFSVHIIIDNKPNIQITVTGYMNRPGKKLFLNHSTTMV